MSYRTQRETAEKIKLFKKERKGKIGKDEKSFHFIIVSNFLIREPELLINSRMFQTFNKTRLKVGNSTCDAGKKTHQSEESF
jgi:hypothetical protein